VFLTIPRKIKYFVNIIISVITNILFFTAKYGIGGQLVETTEKEHKVFFNAIEAQHSNQISIIGFIKGI
jgi:hypothetical protein